MNNGAPKFGLYLALSLIEMILCGNIFGLIALIMIILANSAYKAGDEVSGASKLKTCKVLLIVGLVTSILASVIFILVFGSAISLALTNGYSCIGSFMF